MDELIKIIKVPVLIKELTGLNRTTAIVYQWIKNGRFDKHGDKVFLKSVTKREHLFTTQAWVKEFLERIYS